MHLRSDNWIAIAVTAGIVVMAIFVVYQPQGDKLEALQAEIASRQNTLEDDSVKASVVPDMVRQIEAMKKRYTGFNRRMPKRKELAGFLQEISSILASEELANQLTVPGDPRQEELFHTLPIIMEFQGSYLSLASLLQRIEKMERLARIQRLSVTQETGEESLDIEVQLNIYFTES